MTLYNRSQSEPICVTDFHFWSVNNYSENRGFENIEIILEGTCEVHLSETLSQINTYLVRMEQYFEERDVHSPHGFTTLYLYLPFFFLVHFDRTCQTFS